jgi:hypothetical protein
MNARVVYLIDLLLFSICLVFRYVLLPLGLIETPVTGLEERL